MNKNIFTIDVDDIPPDKLENHLKEVMEKFIPEVQLDMRNEEIKRIKKQIELLEDAISINGKEFQEDIDYLKEKLMRLEK